VQASTTLHNINSLPRLSRKVISFIIENVDEDINLDQLAIAAGMSKFNFCRKFQSETGLTPVRWLWAFRARLAAEFIGLAPSWNLTDIAFRCGFSSSAHFSRLFKQINGMSPSVYRQHTLESKAHVHSHVLAAYDGNEDLIASVAMQSFGK